MTRSLGHWYRYAKHVLVTNGRLSRAHLSSAAEPKLHVGSSWRRLDGWLNADIDLIPEVVQMDATRRFPFADASFQFVYTEHMIEHVSREQGAFMLRECHRVLRKGGVIRVTTPDLSAILGLYAEKLPEIQRDYLSWFCNTFLSADAPHTAATAINAFFRLWGHQFIYDEDILRTAMSTAGFRSIARRKLGESDYCELRSLENIQRYPDGFLEFESMALEGFK